VQLTSASSLVVLSNMEASQVANKHGRNLVGDTGDEFPTFSGGGGYNMPCPPTFSLQVLYLEKLQQ